jgi:hypothetical protein
MIDNPNQIFNGVLNYEKYKREYYKTMANIPIKYRTAKNFNTKPIDFSVTILTGDLEVNFYICPVFCPSAPDAESSPY